MPEPRATQSKEPAAVPLVGGRRLNVVGWARPGDRQICAWAYYERPEQTPSVLRHQLAGARLFEVDRTSTSILLCNRLHENVCEWPGGEVAGEIDEANNERIMAEAAAAADASRPGSAFQPDEAPPIDPTPRRRR